jgi:hypothetical protein
MTTKSKKLTSADSFRAVILLRMCSTAQTELWNRSKELEKILGCAVNTTLDLEGETIDAILNRDEAV